MRRDPYLSDSRCDFLNLAFTLEVFLLGRAKCSRPYVGLTMLHIFYIYYFHIFPGSLSYQEDSHVGLCAVYWEA